MMQSFPGGSPARRTLVLAAAFLCCGPRAAGVATGGDALPAAAERVDPESLARREQDLARQFRDLEKTFLRLADLLSTSDPRRAAVLRSVFARAREEAVGDRLDTIVQLLEQGQLLKAGTSQAGAIEKMRLLLDLLESGDTDRRLANTKEEVKQFITRLSKLISRQRDIEGSTEAGTGETQLSERQQSLADETRGLSEEIGGFARRMDSRQSADGETPAGEPAGQDREGKGGAEQGGEADGGKPGGENATGDTPASPPNDGAPQQDGDQPKTPADGSSSKEQEDGAGEPRPGDAGPQPSADEGDDEAARARRTRRRMEAAEKRMRQAQQRLDQAKRREARGEQEKAIEDLETARAELEEILRQLREQEVERLLVQLEARIRAMLRSQRAVLAGAEKLAGEAAVANAADGSRPVTERERQLEAVRLGREQTAIGNDASRAVTLVRDDGSAVAIPEALEQVRDDSVQAATRLSRGDVSGTTRGLLQDIVASLEEMLAALEKAQREQQARQENPSGGRPAEPGEQPLVDKLSELKMIRSLQMRVNTRTKRFAQLLAEDAEQADEPELLEALARLAARQRKIERAAHDIVTGRTE